MIKKINILILIFLTFFLYSCQGAREALQSKKRSDQSDEFLVQKKNPLVLPPDFTDLPQPFEESPQATEIKIEEDIEDKKGEEGKITV